MASWFTDLANQALKLVDDFTDSVVAQANEAQQQIIQEQKKLEQEETQRRRIFQDRHLLPWETEIEARQILSQDLMEKVFQLSFAERNFTVRSPNADMVDFDFQDFIPVAMQLLQLDANLARVHAKLSPKMNEEEFWFNYYCRVVYLRARSGIDGPEALQSATKWREAEIVLASEYTAPPSTERSTATAAPTSRLETKSNASTTSSTVKVPAAAALQAQQSSHGSHEADEDIDLEDLDQDLSQMKDLELLEELDDISPEDFEQIGSSEGNDELEAQIAQELAEDSEED